MNKASTIKALETSYRGHRFRSRLEARWAVFFDAIGWAWEYEPQGYALRGGLCYLPDFLVEGDYFVEVKPALPTDEEKTKALRLAKGLNSTVVFGIGPPDAKEIAYGLGGYSYAADGGSPEDGRIKSRWRDGLLSFSGYCFSKWARPGWYTYMEPWPEDFEACIKARAQRFG